MADTKKRVTVTLNHDIYEFVKNESEARGVSISTLMAEYTALQIKAMSQEPAVVVQKEVIGLSEEAAQAIAAVLAKTDKKAKQMKMLLEALTFDKN